MHTQAFFDAIWQSRGRKCWLFGKTLWLAAENAVFLAKINLTSLFIPMRRVVCVLYPNLNALDAVGPMQVFATANTELGKLGRPPAYELFFLANTVGPVASSGGYSLYATSTWDSVNFDLVDTVIIPGGLGVTEAMRDDVFLSRLKSVEPKVRRFGSVCSGSLLLAQCGLLDGLRATTHWDRAIELSSNFPAVIVDLECIHTFDPQSSKNSHIFTSAGVTSGIDLSISLVEQDLGRPLALAVAKHMIVFLKRPGNHAQFSQYLILAKASSSKLIEIIEWISINTHLEINAELISEKFNIPQRTLHRIFVGELGLSPSKYIEKTRVERAVALLTREDLTMENISQTCGFGHVETFRRTFFKHMGVNPIDYKKRFA
ncbi:MAG: helix-turn-helix domain-containing protein [Acidovorax sp.]